MEVEHLNAMIADIDNIYARYMKENRGTGYVFAKLWEDYCDEIIEDEEMLVYNLIIAKKNLEEREVSDNNWKCINKVIRNYEKNCEKIKLYFSKEENEYIFQIYSNLIK